jgi:hypothetical protein
MSGERIHAVAPDGRTFTFAQWVEYLDRHPEDVSEPYAGPAGKVYEVDGFVFNVHGHCLNAHTFRIAPQGGRIDGQRCYIDVRTWRDTYSRQDRRIVWWADIFASGCEANAYGRLGPDAEFCEEEDAVHECLLRAKQSLERKIEWYLKAIESARSRSDDDEGSMGYGAALSRQRKMLKLVEQEIEDRMQYKLF